MNDVLQLELAYHISGLIYKYFFREISADELTALHNWAYASPENEALFEEMKDPVALSDAFECFQKFLRASTLMKAKSVISNISVP